MSPRPFDSFFQQSSSLVEDNLKSIPHEHAMLEGESTSPENHQSLLCQACPAILHILHQLLQCAMLAVLKAAACDLISDVLLLQNFYVFLLASCFELQQCCGWDQHDGLPVFQIEIHLPVAAMPLLTRALLLLPSTKSENCHLLQGSAFDLRALLSLHQLLDAACRNCFLDLWTAYQPASVLVLAQYANCFCQSQHLVPKASSHWSCMHLVQNHDCLLAKTSPGQQISFPEVCPGSRLVASLWTWTCFCYLRSVAATCH
mmetsp:Transcript_22636/g.47518  ORF Transcript_22636/g.47518 Transcript_22636/m.47518 type:complete len:259 (-) Transcript_22636:1941-2717(-)